MSYRNLFTLVCVFVFLSFYIKIVGQPELMKEKSREVEQLEAVIEEIKGEVEVRIPKENPKEEKWEKAALKAKLPGKTKIATSIDSSVKLNFTNNIIVEVGGLTIMELTEIFKKRDEINARVKVDLGSLKFNIGKKEKFRSNLKVETRSSTASVTGTEWHIVYYPDTGARFNVRDGRVRVVNTRGQKIDVLGGERTNDRCNLPAKVEEEERRVIHQPVTGTTEAEQRIITDTNIGEQTSTSSVSDTGTTNNPQQIIRLESSATPLPAPPQPPGSKKATNSKQ